MVFRQSRCDSQLRCRLHICQCCALVGHRYVTRLMEVVLKAGLPADMISNHGTQHYPSCPNLELWVDIVEWSFEQTLLSGTSSDFGLSFL